MQRARKTQPLEAERLASASPASAALAETLSLSLLPRLAADFFRRMTDEEKLEFLRLVGVEVLEEWLATVELVDDPEVQASLKRAKADVGARRVREVPL